jgi:serine/threonine protein kinase/outer membrane protein assembly factor BamB
MSTVYVARDLRFGQVERLCAIKEMFDVDPDQRVRALRMVNFERESALLATLSHPAIPRIYDYFSFNGLIYLVLEYIDGHDLERLLGQRKSAFDEVQVVQWATEITDVLSMLHAQKPDPIIFRDLKPSNIMLRSSGQLVLVDFGIARTIQGRQRGTMIGTEGYAPPEQYRGIADARGDIYALGATLHHLVTNSDPRIETPFTFHERSVRKINPEVSEEFSAVIMKMLAYNPADRYQNVADVRSDLTMVQRLAFAPLVEIRPVEPPASIEADSPTVARADNATVPEPEIERKASKRRAARRRRQDTEVLADRVAWSTQTSDEVRGSAVFDGQAFIVGSYDQHVYAVGPVDGSVRWRVRTGRGVVSRPAVYDELVIFGSEDHYVYGVNRQSGSIVWTQRTGMPVRSSPTIVGGSVVIGSDDGQIYCLDAVSGAVRWKIRTWGPVRGSAALLGQMVYIGSDDAYLYAIDAETGHLRWRNSSGSPIQSTAAVADSSVIIASRGGLVRAVDGENGASIWQHETHTSIVASPRIADELAVVGVANGSLLALSTTNGTVTWLSRFANQITATALLAETVGYVGTIDGDCVCFRLATGEVIWRHQVGGSIVSTPAYGNGVLVIGSIDGRICGIALSNDEIESLQKGQ